MQYRKKNTTSQYRRSGRMSQYKRGLTSQYSKDNEIEVMESINIGSGVRIRKGFSTTVLESSEGRVEIPNMAEFRQIKSQLSKLQRQMLTQRNKGIKTAHSLNSIKNDVAEAKEEAFKNPWLE